MFGQLGYVRRVLDGERVAGLAERSSRRGGLCSLRGGGCCSRRRLGCLGCLGYGCGYPSGLCICGGRLSRRGILGSLLPGGGLLPGLEGKR